tara:strand:+ start:922 stop:4341 length:3420 start_codon:yes stop_codon:yes gene_type:complete
MDYGSSSSTLSLTGGDNLDDIADTLLNLATTTSNNQILINDNTTLIHDVSGSLNTLDAQVQDISGVVDENIIFMNDVSYNLNILNIFTQDVSSQVQDLSGVVDENILAIDINNILIDDVSGSLTALLNVVTDLSANFYTTEHGANIINVSNSLTDLSGSHYALQTVVVDLSTNFYILTGTTIPDINLFIDDLSSNHYALENVVVDLCGNVATNVTDIADISGLVQTNIASIVSHNNRITAAEGTLQDLQDELDALDDDGAGGSVFDAIFGAGTVVSLATVASLAVTAYNLAVAAGTAAATANTTNSAQALEIDALETTRQYKLVDSNFPNTLIETNTAGIYNITSSGLIDSAVITASSTITSSSTITGNAFSSTNGYAVGETQITPSYIDLYSTTTTISGEYVNINGNTEVNINGNINLNGGSITGVNTLGFSGSAITGLDTLSFKTLAGASASISNLKSVAGENFTIQADGDAIFGSKTISALQTATQVGALITTAINTLVGSAGSGYDTLKELQDEIENNDVSLNEVFTNVATKVSKSGDTMTGNLNFSGSNVGINILSSTRGYTRIADGYDINYLSNNVGTRIRTFNSSAYDTVADLYGTGITLYKDTDITGDLTVGGDATINGDLNVSSGTSGNCVLTLEANTNNNEGSENDTCYIDFKQDGSRIWNSIYTTSNELNIANTVGVGGGIVFRTYNVDTPTGGHPQTNAIQRMKIENTGDITINNDLSVAGDATINNAFVGTWEGGDNYAVFCNQELKNDNNDYAIRQGADGNTIINSNSTQPLHFRIGNANKMVIASDGDITMTNDLSVAGDASVAGVLYLNSDGNIDEKFMEWNYNESRLFEFNSYDGGVDIISKTNGKNMNWVDPYGNGIFTILNTGTGTANLVISRCPFVIDSPVRADLDMKMVCGSASSGITENKLYLKSGDDDGGATYLQYQDGTNAVEGVEIYVKDTALSPNRVAQFQEDIIVLEKDVSVLGVYKQGSNPLINVSLCAYQASANPSANSYINLHFLHPFVNSRTVSGIASISESHRDAGNAIYHACFPYRFKLSAIVLMYDTDSNTNSTRIKFRVNSSSSGNGSLTDTVIQSASKASTQRTQTINNFTHIAVPSGVFSAQISHSTSTSPETTVYFYGYQY